MIVKINSMKSRPFKGGTGEDVPYFWYKALRAADQVSIEFGSANGTHLVGAEMDLDIEKRELPGGRIGYREVKS